MSFRFNFEVGEVDVSGENSKDQESEQDQVDDDDTKEPPLVVVEDVAKLLRERYQEPIQYDTVSLSDETCVSAPLLRARERSSDLAYCDEGTNNSKTDKIVQELERKQIDILPGIYEGGLKVWECSIDVCQFLIKHWLDPGGETIDIPQSGYVLELGCGHALPGCLVLRQELMRRYSSEENVDPSPFCVLLAEYNDFVLRDVTLSNIMLNTISIQEDSHDEFMDVVSKHVVLVGGDWMDLSNQLQSGSLPQQSQQEEFQPHEEARLPPNGRFDLILAAETTYTSKSAKDTATLMGRHLDLEKGVGLVATKRYYFGVGGGSDAFRDAVASHRIVVPASEANAGECEYMLQFETLQVYDNGAGNIRELLSVKCVKASL